MFGEHIGAICAFVCGGLVSTANYFLTKKMTNDEDIKTFSKSFMLRLGINAVFITSLYFVSENLTEKSWQVLLSGVLGLSITGIIFSFLLLKRKNQR